MKKIEYWIQYSLAVLIIGTLPRLFTADFSRPLKQLHLSQSFTFRQANLLATAKKTW